MKNYYEIIGVDKYANEQTIKNAYLFKLKKYHPDLYLGDKTFAEQKTKELNIAYDTLKDANLRKVYDEKIGIHKKVINNSANINNNSKNTSNNYDAFRAFRGNGSHKAYQTAQNKKHKGFFSWLFKDGFLKQKGNKQSPPQKIRKKSNEQNLTKEQQERVRLNIITLSIFMLLILCIGLLIVF